MTDQKSTQASTRIFIPADTTALSVGADEVAKTILERAARDDVAVEIVRTGSRGMCWLEPFIEVDHPDGRVGYGPVTSADVASLFEKNFLAGGQHRLGHGLVDLMDYLAKQDRVVFARAGITRPDSLDDYMDHSGMTALDAALEMTPQAIIDEVKASGLRGRGGAGFPTGIKWQTVADAPIDVKKGDRKYIVCNADEGDSGTFSDRLVMEGDPFMLLEGMIIAGLAVGAEKGLIYLRSEYPLAHQRLNTAIKILQDDDWLGDNVAGRGKRFDIEVRLGAGAYICGEETALLESLEGNRGQIRSKPPLPAIEGLFGQPTVVNNVISLATIPAIIAAGGDAFAGRGTGRSRGTMPFQLGGNVARGGLVEVPFGLTLRELIKDFGGGTQTGKPLKAVQVGGPLGAYFAEDKLDTPLDIEAFAAAGGMIGHGGVVVFDEAVNMAEQARFALEFCAAESCGKCTPCRIGSVRGVEVIDKIMAGVDTAANHMLLKDLLTVMEDGSLCAMGGLTPMPVKSALDYFSVDFEPAPRKPGESL